jgi:hypothetical protein
MVQNIITCTITCIKAENEILRSMNNCAEPADRGLHGLQKVI